MAERDDNHNVDHAAEIDGSSRSDAKPTETSQDPHAAHHHSYDPTCEKCRRVAETEYKRKLASGELNRIDFVD